MKGSTASPLQSATSAPPARLVIEKGEHQGMVFPLRDSIVSIGRGPDNTIQIIDARMSRNHSLVLQTDGSWYARDLGSKNGTLHNEAQLRGDKLLVHGDLLQVGDTVFVYEQDSPAGDSTGAVTTGVRLLEDDGLMVASEVLKLRDELGSNAELSALGQPETGLDRVNVIFQVSDVISSLLDLDLLLERVVDLVQQYFCPDRVGILLYDEQYGVMVPKAIRRPPGSTEDIVISNSIITRAVSEQVAVLVSDAPHDVRFQASDSIVIQRIHSAICVPLIHKDDALGVIYLDRRTPGRNYDSNDLKLVAVIAHLAALAISNSRLHTRMLEQQAQELELQIARHIQEHLLPMQFPEHIGFDLYGLSHAARQVGGDYFDVIELHDGRIMVVVADVSGKGVPAALLVASVRAAVQVEARGLPEMGLQELVQRLNHMVCRDVSNNMFVTMFIAVLDPARRELSYCNAGHVHPILRLVGGKVQSLEEGGCFLGIMPGVQYDVTTHTLPPGSTLLIYTDGVTDTLNDQREMFGLQRTVDLLQSTAGMPADRACREFEAALDKFRKTMDFFDDFTVLIIRSLPLPNETS